jgi:hypothetical protein
MDLGLTADDFKTHFITSDRNVMSRPRLWPRPR